MVSLKNGKNIIREDVLAPEPFYNITLSGKNTSSILKGIGDIIEDSVGKVELITKEIKWNPGDNGVEFFGVWEANMGYDSWTKLYFTVRIIGNENKEKEGTVNVVIHPYIETEIEVNNMMQKVYWILWGIIFYDNRRVEYMQSARSSMIALKQALYGRMGVGVNLHEHT